MVSLYFFYGKGSITMSNRIRHVYIFFDNNLSMQFYAPHESNKI